MPYNGYAETLRALGRLDEALSAYREAKQFFPNEVVPYTGYAETLRDLGWLKDAHAAYDAVIERFTGDRAARNAKARLLVEQGAYHDARAWVELDGVRSRADWRDHHVAAMAYLREGEYAEARRRLEYGLAHATFAEVRAVYRSALALLDVQERRFREAVERLADRPESNVVRFPGPRLLRAHAESELGDRPAAEAGLVATASNLAPDVVALRTALAQRYDLRGPDEPTAKAANDDLDAEIERREFALILDAA